MTSLQAKPGRPSVGAGGAGDDGGGVAPLDTVEGPQASAGYSAPGQDNTRALYHDWFRAAEQPGSGVDAGGEGLKNAVSTFENSWYVAAALTMTIGFAEILYVPEGQHPGSTGDRVAKWLYVGLALFGTINSVMGVWWAGHMVPQVSWHPAAAFSKFWFASMNTAMGRAQQFAKVALQQLVLSLVPVCYLNFGDVGLALSAAAVVYMYLQVRTWGFLMQRMRDAYAEGVSRGSPVLDDVSSLPGCCIGPHSEGVLGWLSCQLVDSTCFSFRWLYDPRKPRRSAADGRPVRAAGAEGALAALSGGGRGKDAADQV